VDVLIDVTRLLYRRWAGRLPTGIDRVALEYVRHFGARARALLVAGPVTSVLSPADSAAAFCMLLEPAVNGGASAARLFVKAFLRGWPGSGGDLLLRISHTGLEKPGHVAALRRHGARMVVFVHDLIPLTHPQYCRSGLGAEQEARLRGALGFARGVIANSSDTLRVLEQWAGAAGIPLPPAVVAPLASSLPPPEPAPRPIASPYFVVLGTIEARKNHVLLLRIWQRLVARLGAAAPRLVVVGRRGWGAAEAIELLEKAEPRALAEERGRCTDAELVSLLRHAQALLYPSFAEGYGIPVAEALALGCPVIASDLPALREAGGEAPEYLSPLDAPGWESAILDYANASAPRRAAQLERLRNFRPGSWPQHFETVDRFLESL